MTWRADGRQLAQATGYGLHFSVEGFGRAVIAAQYLERDDETLQQL